MTDDKPTRDVVKDPVVFRSGLSWIALRLLPIAAGALLAGVLVGWLRHGTDFFPGLQGIFWGGALGAAAGFVGRRDPPMLWRGGQRFWAFLTVQLSFFAALFLTLSLIKRPALAPPLTWLREVLGGSSGELFFGASVFNPLTPVAGNISGGAWIAFNLLDAVLFFFCGIIAIGIVIQKYNPRGEGKRGSGPVHYEKPLARRFFVAHAVAVIVVFSILGAANERRSGPRFDSAAIARMEALSGRWVFDDGARLLGAPGEAGAFILEVRGFDLMVGRSETGREYTLSLHGTPPAFTGTLRHGHSSTSIRARFSEDGGELTLAGRTRLRDGSRVDAVVTARRRD